MPIAIAIASNAIVWDNTASTGGENMNNSRIAWDNVLTRATTVTGSVDDTSTDNLFDYMTTTFWSAGSGTQTVTITLPTAETIDCAAVAAGNWADAGTVIEVYSDAGTTKVGEVSGLKNGQPYYFNFDPVSIAVMQFKFISSNALTVGQLMFGESMKIPTSASVGLQLGKFNNKDKVIGQLTELNALSSNSTVSRGRETIAPYQFLPISWIESDWVAFSDAQRGKPIWFSWDYLNNPSDCTFGHWSTDNVKYTSSFFSAFTLTVDGQI